MYIMIFIMEIHRGNKGGDGSAKKISLKKTRNLTKCKENLVTHQHLSKAINRILKTLLVFCCFSFINKPHFNLFVSNKYFYVLSWKINYFTCLSNKYTWQSVPNKTLFFFSFITGNMESYEPSILYDTQLPTGPHHNHLQNMEDIIAHFPDQVFYVQSNLLIFSFCARENIHEDVMYTAMMYVHRFSIKHFHDFNVPLISASCLSFASQIAKQTIDIEQIYRNIFDSVRHVPSIFQPCSNPLDINNFSHRSNITENLQVKPDMKSPVTATLDVCSKLNASPELADASRYIGMIILISSPLCHIYNSEVLACAFINAALHIVPENLTLACGIPWYQQILPFANMEFITSLTNEVENILRQMCPVVNCFYQASFMKGLILWRRT